MWLCLNNAFLSVVAHYDDPEKLLVRARVKGHIEAVFPHAKLYQREGSDYLYRADLARTEVTAAISARLTHINYTNFKSTVKDRRLHGAYNETWHAMGQLQPGGPYGKSKKRVMVRPHQL